MKLYLAIFIQLITSNLFSQNVNWSNLDKEEFQSASTWEKYFNNVGANSEIEGIFSVLETIQSTDENDVPYYKQEKGEYAIGTSNNKLILYHITQGRSKPIFTFRKLPTHSYEVKIFDSKSNWTFNNLEIYPALIELSGEKTKNSNGASIKSFHYYTMTRIFTPKIHLNKKDESNQYVKSGQIEESSGSEYKAILEYSQAIKIDNSNTNAYLKRGFAYMWNGDKEAALADYQSALALDPENAKTHYQLGQLYTSIKGSEELAISYYNRAIELDPNDYNTHFELGLLLMERDYEQATKSLSNAINLDPLQARGYNNRAHCNYELNKYNKSALDYSLYLELEQADPVYKKYRSNAYFKRGMSYMYLNKYDKACIDFNEAKKLGYKDKIDKYIRDNCNR